MAYGIHTEYIFEEAIETELLTHGGYIKGLSEDFDADLGLFPSYLVTKLKRNMKSTVLTPVMDAIMLRKRAIAETIIDQLKNICQVEHSRHRSPKNFFNNLFAALIAYKLTIKTVSKNAVRRYQTVVLKFVVIELTLYYLDEGR